MAISNKDKYIFDWWNNFTLFHKHDGENNHRMNSYYQAKRLCKANDQFILSKKVYESELFRTLYGY